MYFLLYRHGEFPASHVRFFGSNTMFFLWATKFAKFEVWLSVVFFRISWGVCLIQVHLCVLFPKQIRTSMILIRQASRRFLLPKLGFDGWNHCTLQLVISTSLPLLIIMIIVFMIRIMNISLFFHYQITVTFPELFWTKKNTIFSLQQLKKVFFSVFLAGYFFVGSIFSRKQEKKQLAIRIKTTTPNEVGGCLGRPEELSPATCFFI